MYMYMYLCIYIYRVPSPRSTLSHMFVISRKRVVILQLVNQLLATDLALLHGLHPLHDALQSAVVLVHHASVRLHLPLGQEFCGYVDELGGEVEVFGHGGHFHVVDEGEGFANREVGQDADLRNVAGGVKGLHGFIGDGEEGYVLAWGGGAHGWTRRLYVSNRRLFLGMLDDSGQIQGGLREDSTNMQMDGESPSETQSYKRKLYGF